LGGLNRLHHVRRAHRLRDRHAVGLALRARWAVVGVGDGVDELRTLPQDLVLAHHGLIRARMENARALEST
jgi:hypothetical protein